MKFNNIIYFTLATPLSAGNENDYQTRTVSIRTRVEFTDTPNEQRFLAGEEAEIICEVDTDVISMTTEWYLPPASGLLSPVKGKCRQFIGYLQKIKKTCHVFRFECFLRKIHWNQKY